MAWLENAVKNISHLPKEIEEALAQIREHDRRNRDFSTQINDDEATFLEELQNAIKSGIEIDEAAAKAKAEELISKRRELQLMMDAQTKISQGIYEKLGISVDLILIQKRFCISNCTLYIQSHAHKLLT
jgi:hypothetical protein